MLKTLFSIPPIRYAAIIMVSILMGATAHWYWAPTKVTIVKEPGQTYTEMVYVDKPILTTKEVIKYVTDTKEVEKLMTELTFVKQKVTTLTEAIKVLESKGAGTIIYRDVPGPAGQTVREASFKDWRLTFTAKDDRADYTLTQKFEVLATTGRDVNGKPTATTRLFEIGPNGERTIATAVEQKVIVGNATDGEQHWRASLNLVAGMGYSYQTTVKTSSPGGVLGARWLTRGTTKAAEDGVWAAASPVVLVDQKGKTEFGILPISYNAGQVAPFFKDLWVSPLVGVTAKPFGVHRFGATVTATF